MTSPSARRCSGSWTLRRNRRWTWVEVEFIRALAGERSSGRLQPLATAVPGPAVGLACGAPTGVRTSMRIARAVRSPRAKRRRQARQQNGITTADTYPHGLTCSGTATSKGDAYGLHSHSSSAFGTKCSCPRRAGRFPGWGPCHPDNLPEGYHTALVGRAPEGRVRCASRAAHERPRGRAAPG